MRHILSLLLSLLAALVLAATTTIGGNTVTVVTDPATVPIGKANLIVTITSPDGKPLEDATVIAIARMPGMNMGEREQPGREREPGVYVVPAVFAMGGAYEITLTVNGQTGTVKMSTGETTTGGSSSEGGSVWPWLLGAGGLAAAWFVVRRMRRTGQSVDPRLLFSRQVVWALLVLGAAVAVAVWAVNTQRRPGSMTPIEAQVMEMNTPAPEGVFSVELAAAEVAPFSATVKYSGQAVGYVEQDVVARVTGAIVSMPGYVGTEVRKGDVLARLDTTILDPEVAMAAAGVGSSEQAVRVAQLEHEESLNMIAQANAEVSMAKSEQAEAKAMLVAAEQGEASADAEVKSSKAEVAAMEAEAKGALAERDYMKAELARANELYSKGALSKDEFQRARADAERAEAMLGRANQGVVKARQMVAANEAMRRKVDAEIVAAKRKFDQAGASLQARRAMLEAAQTRSRTAGAKVSQEVAMVREQMANLKSANALRGFATLRAETDGVIVKRLISPGQVVSSGQAVLRVAQLSPIRLQANVAEVDLARIRLGARVRAIRAGGEPIEARVTSISPAVDAASRTGLVEALFDNKEREFRAGQFVSLEIQTGTEEPQLSIPASAVVRQGERAYVFVAEPSLNGQHELSRVEVEVGDRAGDRVAVLKGLGVAQKVVVAPSPDLKTGARVTAPEPLGEASASTTVIVTAAGYEPASVPVPANQPFSITFIRKADSTCGETLVFPSLKIERALPINVPVTVNLPPQPAGELKFACGMDMLQGKVVVQ